MFVIDELFSKNKSVLKEKDNLFSSPFFFQESKMVGSSKKKRMNLKRIVSASSSEILEIYFIIKDLETKK